MARVLLNRNESFNIINNNVDVVGNTGTETIVIFDNMPFDTANTMLDQSVEHVQFQAASNAYKFQQVGNVLRIYQFDGDLIATVPVGTGNNLDFSFDNGKVVINFSVSGSSAGKITVGGEVVSTVAGGAQLVAPVLTNGNSSEQPSHQPTAQEQFMLELLNRARMNPVEEASLLGIDLNEGLAAGTLSTNPRQPLAFNNELTAAARSHSQDMLDNDFFAHTNLAGNSPFDRIQAAGYTYTTAGENLAYVGTTATLSQALINTFVQDSHEDLFVDEGIIGRGHRINMLNANFKEIGIGIVDGSFNNGNADFNVVMSTQNFATQPNAKAILLGVIYADADNNAFYTPGEGIGDVSIVILNTATNTTQTLYSMTAGGYQVALQTGVYDITYTFDGNTQFVNDLVIGVDNVKSDWLIA